MLSSVAYAIDQIVGVTAYYHRRCMSVDPKRYRVLRDVRSELVGNRECGICDRRLDDTRPVPREVVVRRPIAKVLPPPDPQRQQSPVTNYVRHLRTSTRVIALDGRDRPLLVHRDCATTKHLVPAHAIRDDVPLRTSCDVCGKPLSTQIV